MWFGYGGHMAWMWLWWIVGLGVLSLLVWAGTRVVQSPPRHDDDLPEAILKRRYARGEISEEEYERRLAGLRK